MRVNEETHTIYWTSVQLSCLLLQTHDSEAASVLSSDRIRYHEAYSVVSVNKYNLNLTDQTKQLYVIIYCRV